MSRPDIRNHIDNILDELAWCINPGAKPVEERILGIMLSVAALSGEIEQEMKMYRAFEKHAAALNYKVDADRAKKDKEASNG